MTPAISDSITVSLTGYQSVSLRTDATKFLTLTLRVLQVSAGTQRNRLLSFTGNVDAETRRHLLNSGESYSSLKENEFVETDKYPQTGFAIRIDKASYSNVRRFLTMSSRVPSDAVRMEELMNYFNFGYTAPVPDSVFGFSTYVSDCPWNENNQLLFLKVCARKIDSASVPPSNLVFLIDVSGSMDMPNRLPLLKSAFKLLVDNLHNKDTISIVVYGGATGVWLTPTCGSEKVKIRKAIEELTPGGSTPGQSGILSAYSLAKSQFIKGGNNRVILATDGDFNVGQNSEDQLEKLITAHQQSGIYLTCLGVGMGNYKDSKLEVLAKKGNGNFSYLDNELEAEKVLVKELTQTLYSVADDASLNIRFNKDYVKSYRLMGYDNKIRALADSAVELEGGEVGSGHAAMVLFEIEPSRRLVDYFQGAGQDVRKNIFRKPLADIRVQYRLPGDSLARVTGFPVDYDYTTFDELPACYRFASSVAMFGSLLKESAFAKKMSWAQALHIASNSYDKDDSVQKEFLAIIEKARKIYSRTRRRKS